MQFYFFTSEDDIALLRWVVEHQIRIRVTKHAFRSSTLLNLKVYLMNLVFLAICLQFLSLHTHSSTISSSFRSNWKLPCDLWLLIKYLLEWPYLIKLYCFTAFILSHFCTSYPAPGLNWCLRSPHASGWTLHFSTGLKECSQRKFLVWRDIRVCMCLSERVWLP